MTDKAEIVNRIIEKEKIKTASRRMVAFCALGLSMCVIHLVLAAIFEKKFISGKRIGAVFFIGVFGLILVKYYKKTTQNAVVICIVVTELTNGICLFYAFYVYPETQIVWALCSIISYIFLQGYLFSKKLSIMLISLKQSLIWVIGIGYTTPNNIQNTIIVIYGFVLTFSYFYLVTHLENNRNRENCSSKVKIEMANRKISSIFEAISNYIIVIDENLNILFANTATDQKFGSKVWSYLSSSKYYRRSFYKTNTESQIIDDIQHHFKNTSDEKITFGLAKNTGEIIEWRGKLTEWDKKHSIILIGRDVTEIVKMEKENLQGQYKSELLRTVSHELRTPVSAVLSLAELVKSSPDKSKENFERLEMICGTCSYQLSIINDLLDYSQIISGTLKVSKMYFNIVNLLKECLQLTQIQIKETEVKLDLMISELPEIFYSDPHRLKQIVLNLLTNARKFTVKGSITLEAAFNDSLLRIKCIDTGIGIPKDRLKYLFNEFGKLEDPNSMNPQGVGLGLFISNMLVKELGGHGIEVASEENKGSCFSFVIKPELLSEISDVAEEKLNVYVPSILTKTILMKNEILIVDDTYFNIIAIVGVLTKQGIKCSYSLSGGDAISKIKQNTFCCVLMDCEMPILDGWETTKQIHDLFNKQQIAYLPQVIALTAHNCPETHKKCLECGMCDVLVKPCPQEDLLQKLTFWISAFSLNHQ